MKKFEGLPRDLIALRVSKEIEDNSYVNLGIGIPTLVSNWLEGRDVILQSEIGMLKTGSLAEGADVDQDLINASCQPVLEVPGTVYFDISESFAMIRGGHVDVTVMGAFQVNESGDFASWLNPSRGWTASETSAVPWTWPQAPKNFLLRWSTRRTRENPKSCGI